MRFGLQQQTIAKIASVFEQHPEVKQVILYGSRALGTHREESDIDLALTGKALDFKALARIATELDDLLLPYSFDLSIYRLIDNDSLRNHIKRVGILLYKKKQQGAAAMKPGWQVRKLGEVCSFEKVQGIHRGLPYVGMEHIESHTARFLGSEKPLPVKSTTFRFSDKHVLYGRLRPRKEYREAVDLVQWQEYQDYE